jgi:CheY-like chemotaxis protein
LAFFHKISAFLRHKSDTDIDSESTLRGQMLSFTLLSLLVFNFIFAVFHLFFLEIADGVFLFAVFLCFLATYIYYRNKNNYKLSLASSIIWMTCIFSFLIYKGIGSNSVIIWGLGYPVIFAFLTDYKRSGILTIVFLIYNLFLLVFSNYISENAEYSLDIILRFTAVYILLFMFVQFYMRIRQHAFSVKEKKIIDSKQRIDERNTFLSDLSYKLRTPLNTITGILNVQREKLDENTVEEIELSLSNLIAIINSISEVFDQKITPILGKETFFDLNQTVKKSVKLFQSDKYSRLKIQLNLSGALNYKLYGDRLLFIQMIISVIDFLYKNILKDQIKLNISTEVSENEGLKTISLKIQCKKKQLLISSEGEKFENSNEMKLIKELVNSAKAKMTIIDTEEESAFVFSLSYPSEHEFSSTLELQNKRVVKETDLYGDENKQTSLKDANILLVEDDSMNSKVLTLNLSKLVNKIIIAENGKEALEKYASTKIDLILMDIRMPLMDGFKTTEKIREAEIGTGSQTPIIAVTANAVSEVKQKCFEVGMNDFTTKPINFKLLIKKMEDLLK